jgi:beta-glucanase (GH16 family)
MVVLNRSDANWGHDFSFYLCKEACVVIQANTIKGRRRYRPKKIIFCILVFLSILAVITVVFVIYIPRRVQSARISPAGVVHTNTRWKLIFDDEFNGTSLDTSKWMLCYHSGTCTNSGNEEDEWYIPGNVKEGNGMLTLSAERGPYTANGKTYGYTSGMISSTHFSFVYGCMEMRAKMAPGKGMWSAFWTLPTNGGWPPEIDVQETLGRAPTTVYTNYHFGKNNRQDDVAVKGSDFTAGWHTFATDWEPDAITWYVDGIERARFPYAEMITNEPMYLLANLAVGSNWSNTPDASTVFPAQYEIDFIRVWQKQAGSTTTSPCAVRS